MTSARNLSKTQLQLIERLRVSPASSADLVPEFSRSRRGLRSQVHLIRKHGYEIETRLVEKQGRGIVGTCEYYLV
jgi:biotin operon repressor